MNKLSACAVGYAVVVAAIPPALAGEGMPSPFSGNMTLTSDYLFRGLTQTSESPAIQGGVDYNHSPTGFYLGTWGSSIEFNNNTNSNDSSLELDFYGGIQGEMANGLSWDIGGLYYHYPDQNEDANGDYDFFEVYGALGYEFADIALEPSLGFKLSYSPDFFGEDGNAYYPELSLNLSLPRDFGLGFHVGHQDVEGDKTTPEGFDYAHWSVALSKAIADFEFSLSYNETDEGYPGNLDDEGTTVLSVSRGF